MILHLSDLHFGTEKPECLRAIEQFCKEQQPEAVVVSGDITQRARLMQFVNCKHFLDGLNIPYLVVPGNHDIPLYNVWNRFVSPFRFYQFFFKELEPTLETEHFFIIGVNSVRPRYHTKGHISLEQIQRTDDLLKQAPADKLKLVVLHQPFYTSPGDPHGMEDSPVLAKVALNQWGKSGLNGLLHGHLHKSAVYNLTEVLALDCDHNIYDIHAGTATSHRLYKNLPNGFNVILNDGQVEFYTFDKLSKRFVLNHAR